MPCPQGDFLPNNIRPPFNICHQRAPVDAVFEFQLQIVRHLLEGTVLVAMESETQTGDSYSGSTRAPRAEDLADTFGKAVSVVQELAHRRVERGVLGSLLDHCSEDLIFLGMLTPILIIYFIKIPDFTTRPKLQPSLGIAG
jgi:hypothetical protein